MNVFFYAVQKSTQAAEVFQWLESLQPPLHIQTLPCSFSIGSPAAIKLRNGDLIIVFLRSQEELETLINIGIEFSNYSLYLIFQDHDPEVIEAALSLSPKHYSSMEKHYIHTEETLRKILHKNDII